MGRKDRTCNSMTNRIMSLFFFLARFILAAAILVGFFLTVTHFFAPWYLTWGTTTHEQSMKLPGDDLWPHASHIETIAITINATRENVWLWVRQIGQDKGGFYSYELYENMIGSHMHNADHILSNVKDPKEGDKVWMAPPTEFNGMAYAEVARVEPNHSLVLYTHMGGTPTPSAVWQFVLFDNSADSSTTSVERSSSSSPSTRVIVRLLSNVPNEENVFESALWRHIFLPVHFMMERRMLYGIKDRAEGNIVPWFLELLEPAAYVAIFIAYFVSSIASVCYSNVYFWLRSLFFVFFSGVCLMHTVMIRTSLGFTMLLAVFCWMGVIRTLRASCMRRSRDAKDSEVEETEVSQPVLTADSALNQFEHATEQKLHMRSHHHDD
eukprot:TRINITY_DN2798_c0_g1_i1.p1 TRINITY_DN2798_c0_g1~~TRINITY_DN2798_c0_g1_i1.p1  ORF type:complete len:381 (+),score=68.67 TRINITY_DN2798_c0_g1_i1:39-1181(+)